MSKSVLVYAYANCSTCRDAVRWLREHDIAFTEKPIYDQPPSASELGRMLALQGGDLRRLFNTSGLVYRDLDLKNKLPKMSEAEALALLAGNGRLVKRPFVIADSLGLVGFKPDAWAAAFQVGKH